MTELTRFQVRKLRKEYGVILRDMTLDGFVYMGKHNPQMHELRKLGFYRFDKASGVGCGLTFKAPRWQVTELGRLVLFGK